MGALDFARSSFIGAGMGVQGDRVFLVAARAGEIDQDVEWRGFCLRGLPGRVVMAVRRLLHFLSGTLSGVQELIGACEHFLRALAHLVLLPSGGKRDRNLLAVPVHSQRAETP